MSFVKKRRADEETERGSWPPGEYEKFTKRSIAVSPEYLETPPPKEDAPESYPTATPPQPQPAISSPHLPVWLTIEPQPVEERRGDTKEEREEAYKWALHLSSVQTKINYKMDIVVACALLTVIGVILITILILVKVKV